MSEEDPKRRRRWRLWTVLAATSILLAALIVPPMVSIGRYKGQITELISASLGRPVHLSGVKFRLLPWPGFVLSNLVVDEDPAYGYEPVLHAQTVTASFRLLPLWRGRIEIGRISVDQASLNLVRMPDGRWNLDPLFRTANAKAGASAVAHERRAVPLPYLEATNSRIDFKDGVEKLPFSLVNADLSFWQAAPGDWHIRLRGQPARTDISLYQEDTGVVRLEASLHSAPALRMMPLRIDLDWREAQLGQLSRLLIGSDPGWRGNLTAEFHLTGTADTAHVTTRLRATGVHREEFAPAEPLDFDANCGFVYHYARRALQNLVCSSPLGDGHLQLAGDVPGGSGKPHFTLALDQIPVDAALAFLRTIRSGVDPGLSAAGTVSGKMTYTGGEAGTAEPVALHHARRGRHAAGALRAPPTLPLEGSFTVSGFQLSGGSLNQPIQANRIVLQPEQIASGHALALAATVSVPAGAPAALNFTPELTLHGYRLGIHGEVSLGRARDLAHAAGLPDVQTVDALAGGPLSVALNVEGPWLPRDHELGGKLPEANAGAAGSQDSPAEPDPDAPLLGGDRLSGAVTIRDASWKADYLAHPITIAQATLHLAGGAASWDPVDFTYGALKGTASLTLPGDCPAQPSGQPCAAQFAVQLGKLEATELQNALLGAREPNSLFAELIDRLHLSSAPAWPPLEGAVRAEALAVGPVTLTDPVAELRIDAAGAHIESLDAGVLGGRVHATGTLLKPATDQGKPAYRLDARLSGLSAPAVGRLLEMRWTGGPFNAEGKIELTGLTSHGLAASAAGSFSFDWRRGGISAVLPEPLDAPEPPKAKTGAKTNARPVTTPAEPRAQPLPKPLSRFASFAGDGEIANGKIVLRHAEAVQAGRRHAIDAEVTLALPPRVSFATPRDASESRRRNARPVQ